MHKLLAIVVAGCLLILGFGSPPPPYFESNLWLLLYIPLSLLVVWFAWRPDRRKLRWATSIACTVSIVRGVSFLINKGWYSPIALYVILTVLCIDLYTVHRKSLPERYAD